MNKQEKLMRIAYQHDGEIEVFSDFDKKVTIAKLKNLANILDNKKDVVVFGKVRFSRYSKLPKSTNE